MGASNDKAQQNQAAQQQIQQSQQAAQNNLINYQRQNPNPLQGVGALQGPQQASPVFGGQQYSGGSGTGQGQPQANPFSNGIQGNPQMMQLLQALQMQMRGPVPGNPAPVAGTGPVPNGPQPAGATAPAIRYTGQAPQPGPRIQ